MNFTSIVSLIFHISLYPASQQTQTYYFILPVTIQKANGITKFVLHCPFEMITIALHGVNKVSVKVLYGVVGTYLRLLCVIYVRHTEMG